MRAEAQIKIEDIHKRALHRVLQEEARKQANIEEVTRRALPAGSSTSPDPFDDGRLANRR
jgi:hypothetical protein